MRRQSCFNEGWKTCGGITGRGAAPFCLSPALSPAPGGDRVCDRGDDGHGLALAPLLSILGLCPLRSGRGKGGELTNARPLALKIHAEQLFLLGACSWMRLRSGSRGAGEREREREGERPRGDLITPNPLGNHQQ